MLNLTQPVRLLTSQHFCTPVFPSLVSCGQQQADSGENYVLVENWEFCLAVEENLERTQEANQWSLPIKKYLVSVPYRCSSGSQELASLLLVLWMGRYGWSTLLALGRSSLYPINTAGSPLPQYFCHRKLMESLPVLLTLPLSFDTQFKDSGFHHFFC